MTNITKLKQLLAEFQDMEYQLNKKGLIPTIQEAIMEIKSRIKALEDEDLEREDDPKFGEEEEIPDGTEDINDYD